MKFLFVMIFTAVVACAAKEEAPDPVFVEKVPAVYAPSDEIGPEPTPTPVVVRKTFKPVTHDKLLKKKPVKKTHKKDKKKKKPLNPDGE